MQHIHPEPINLWYYLASHGIKIIKNNLDLTQDIKYWPLSKDETFYSEYVINKAN